MHDNLFKNDDKQVKLWSLFITVFTVISVGALVCYCLGYYYKFIDINDWTVPVIIFYLLGLILFSTNSKKYSYRKDNINEKNTPTNSVEIVSQRAHLEIDNKKLKKKLQELQNINQQLSLVNQELELEKDKRESLEERLKYLALYDELTGLPNRTLLKEFVSITMSYARQYSQGIAILFLNLDNFKRINETMGYEIGNSLLRQVVSRLTKCIRQQDYVTYKINYNSSMDSYNNVRKYTIARVGGDEFVIVLNDVSHIKDAAYVAERIKKELQPPFMLKFGQTYITSSVGISIYPQDGEDSDTLIKNADSALNQAKSKGKNCYLFYTSDMNTQVRRRFLLENDLQDSLRKEHFIMHYQPKANAYTGEVIGMEALIRWQHPTKGFIAPDAFIPIAEESGLIIPLGEWILHTVCKQTMSWYKDDLSHLRVSVNVSSIQFRERNLDKMILQILDDTGLPSENLELELTESVLMEDTEYSIYQLRKLKDMGLSLSIDDFGTGYSSLSKIKKYPIDTLKIDRSFIQDIEKSHNDSIIVDTTIDLGHSLRLKVIAEGVENKKQHDFLRARGCDQIQGYYLSKPLSGDEFLHFVKNTQAIIVPNKFDYSG